MIPHSVRTFPHRDGSRSEQRAVMLVVIHQTASTIGQPRDIEQRVRQRIQLTVAQFSGFTLPPIHLPRISTRR